MGGVSSNKSPSPNHNKNNNNNLNSNNVYNYKAKIPGSRNSGSNSPRGNDIGNNKYN